MTTKDRIRPFLAGALVVAYVAAGVALFTTTVPAANKDFVNFLLGGLSTFTGAAIFFYFGDSKGKTPPAPPPAVTSETPLPGP